MTTLFVSEASLIGQASNLQSFSNPPFVLQDFYTFYPQFEGKLDADIVQLYVDFANASVNQTKWGQAWKIGMCNFIAHFCIIHMQGVLSAESSEAQVLSAAQSKGLVSSKSAGDVSVSYDFGPILQELEGWAQWKLTNYGIQFASMAKMIGKGSSYIW